MWSHRIKNTMGVMMVKDMSMNITDIASLMKVCRDYTCEISIHIEPDGCSDIEMKPWLPTKFTTTSTSEVIQRGEEEWPTGKEDG